MDILDDVVGLAYSELADDTATEPVDREVILQEDARIAHAMETHRASHVKEQSVALAQSAQLFLTT